MTDLVERLRTPEYEIARLKTALETARAVAASWRRVAEKLEGEKQDALKAAQAQAAEVRRETVEEILTLILARAVGHSQRQIVHYTSGNDRMGERAWAKQVEAAEIAAAIRALTDAAKGDRT